MTDEERVVSLMMAGAFEAAAEMLQAVEPERARRYRDLARRYRAWVAMEPDEPAPVIPLRVIPGGGE